MWVNRESAYRSVLNNAEAPATLVSCRPPQSKGGGYYTVRPVYATQSVTLRIAMPNFGWSNDAPRL